jgi:hypothetical protein
MTEADIDAQLTALGFNVSSGYLSYSVMNTCSISNSEHFIKEATDKSNQRQMMFYVDVAQVKTPGLLSVLAATAIKYVGTIGLKPYITYYKEKKTGTSPSTTWKFFKGDNMLISYTQSG